MESNKVLNPLDWYRKEISKTYRNLQEAIKQEKNAIYQYNSLMISTFELGYLAVQSKDKEIKERYKNTYKVLEPEYHFVCDAVIKRKGYSDYLRLLKQERAEAYNYESKSRE